jgi:hypothetical protein
MHVGEELLKVKSKLPVNVNLVAVSKTHPTGLIMEAYRAGQRDFGENKVQELVAKYDVLPKDIHWHMIGHLQKNKVKYIAPFISLVHGIDSLSLLEIVNKEGEKNNRTVPCLLQARIAAEETKYGLSEAAIDELLDSTEFRSMKFISIRGLMGMASFTNNQSEIRKEFKYLKTIFNRIGNNYFKDKSNFSVLSMGMSNDYPVAIEEGSTMVRIGSSIFGVREYT